MKVVGWIKVTDRLPNKEDRYFVKGKFHPYTNKITKGCVVFKDGYFHIGKDSKIIEWLDETVIE